MESWIGPAVTATIISSLIAVIGWFVTYGSARRMERVRRREKIRDFRVALLAEIRSESHHLATLDLDTHLASVEQRYRDAAQENKPYFPMVPRPAGPIVFPTLLPEIHLLPEHTIDPVILYFRQVQLVERFVEDLRSTDFRALDSTRQVSMYRDYVGMLRYWKLVADEAAAALQDKPKARKGDSNSAAAHSARKSASASAGASGPASSQSPSSDI